MAASAEAPRCYLLDIPPELRLQIYDHLYTASPPGATLELDDPNHVHRHKPSKYFPYQAALPKTCKTINREAEPVFYDHSSCTLTIFNFGGETFHAGRIPLGCLTDCAFLRRIGRASLDISFGAGMPGQMGTAEFVAMLETVVGMLGSRREMPVEVRGIDFEVAGGGERRR